MILLGGLHGLARTHRAARVERVVHHEKAHLAVAVSGRHGAGCRVRPRGALTAGDGIVLARDQEVPRKALTRRSTVRRHEGPAVAPCMERGVLRTVVVRIAAHADILVVRAIVLPDPVAGAVEEVDLVTVARYVVEPDRTVLRLRRGAIVPRGAFCNAAFEAHGRAHGRRVLVGPTVVAHRAPLAVNHHLEPPAGRRSGFALDKTHRRHAILQH